MYRIHRFRHKRCDGSSNEKDEISLIYSPDEPFYRSPIGSKESFREFVAFVSFIFFFYSPYPILPRHLSFPNNGGIRFHQAINRGKGIKYSIGRIYTISLLTFSFSFFLFFFIPSGVDSTTPWLRSTDTYTCLMKSKIFSLMKLPVVNFRTTGCCSFNQLEDSKDRHVK